MNLRIHHWLPVVLLSFSATAVPKVTQHDAIPVLLRRCVICHGQDAREGGLDLRTKGAMLKGKAFVSGKPNESAMIKRIVSRQCPPDKNISMAGIERMAPRELQTLRDWIAAGAPETQQTLKPVKQKPDARGHWAFQPPKRPAIPKIDIRQSQIRNPIDAFLLRKLTANELDYSPEASTLTLLRRVTFDLTGLPPTLAEMAAFEKDSIRNPQSAFETVVDRLLASPAYGVRWGRHWLDLAGYSDSEGKRNADMIRDYAWRYRDYVINAFNADKPYNEFLIEQIAGDELVDYSNPDAIDANIIEKLVATGFPAHGPRRHQRQSSQSRRGPNRGHRRRAANPRRRRDGADHGMCALPRSQVRPNQPARLLFIRRHFQGRLRRVQLAHPTALPQSMGRQHAPPSRGDAAGGTKGGGGAQRQVGC